MFTEILAQLAKEGLGLLSRVGFQKGKEWLSEKTGVDFNKPELSGEDYLKLEQFQLQHEEELLRIALEEKKLEAATQKMFLDDVNSARDMQKAAVSSGSALAQNFVYNFAIFWSVIAAAYIAAITFMEIPENSIRFADTILGFLLGTIVSKILDFFFGSSFSSKAKTEMLGNIIKEKKQ